MDESDIMGRSGNEASSRQWVTGMAEASSQKSNTFDRKRAMSAFEVKQATATLHIQGMGCLIGEDCERDLEKAIKLITAAATAGDGPAAHTLYYLYSKGEYGVDPDPEKAKKWYDKYMKAVIRQMEITESILGGGRSMNRDSKRHASFGLPDMDGDPFEIEDYAMSQETADNVWDEYCARWNDSWHKSVEEIQTANKRGHSVRDAAYTLYYRGLGYLNGEGCERNPERALPMISAAALTGECPEAILRLAHMYEDGNGVNRDAERAAYWYDKYEKERK